MLRLTIWMNMPSFHQDSLFSALAYSKKLYAIQLDRNVLRIEFNRLVKGMRYPQRIAAQGRIGRSST